jgi:hypothetical protein
MKQNVFTFIHIMTVKLKNSPILVLFSANFGFFIQILASSSNFWLLLYNLWLTFVFFIQKIA